MTDEEKTALEIPPFLQRKKDEPMKQEEATKDPANLGEILDQMPTTAAPTLEDAVEALRQIDAQISDNDAAEAKAIALHAANRSALNERRSAAKKLLKTLARKV